MFCLHKKPPEFFASRHTSYKLARAGGDLATRRQEKGEKARRRCLVVAEKERKRGVGVGLFCCTTNELQTCSIGECDL